MSKSHRPVATFGAPTSEGRPLTEIEAAASLRAFLKVGEDAISRGDGISQEEMERWFASRVAARSR